MSIVSKNPTEQYRDGWDRIFGASHMKKQMPAPVPMSTPTAPAVVGGTSGPVAPAAGPSMPAMPSMPPKGNAPMAKTHNPENLLPPGATHKGRGMKG